MSDPEPAPHSPRPLEEADQVDRLCDQFEAALRQGLPTTIEEVLAAVPESARTELLRELVALEIDFRRGHGETISFLSYFRRFPDAAPVLEELQREWNLRDSSGFIAVREPVKLDGNTETIAYSYTPRQRIKQFELLSILGQGGFGTVWRAKDTLLQRDVAVKVPRKDRVLGMNMSLFLREARAAAKLRHPNIVAIHEVGEEDSSAFIVSDFVDGVSLKVWLETVRPSTTESAMLVAKLATAAHHAHERGIIHRDLKPANVLIDRRGEPHIADFGLAKREAAEDSLAVGEQLVGTPAYMAPEQARGDHKAIDCRSDVYALGTILYELLTGQRAFHGELSLMLNQIQHVPPTSPRKIKSEIPRELEAICLKCLAKDPDQRYQTAQALADDLHRHIAGETLLGIPAALPVRMHKWVRRHRRAVVAAVLLALLAGGAAGYFAWVMHPADVSAEFRVCHFTTDPPGCEITVVPIDFETGEPDPKKIKNAKGLTPDVTMSLAPGDYLVVATLPGEQRFHEVYRTVPTPWDTARTKGGGLTTTSLNWTLRQNGEIEIREIEIPGPEVLLGMGYIKGTDRLKEPVDSIDQPAKQWQVPGFFADVREWRTSAVSESDFTEKFLAELESQGKRLPSAAEIFYLSTVVCPAPIAAEASSSMPDACVLPDPNHTVIEGLHSGRWEWTTTRPDGPFSGVAYSSVMGDLSNLRMVGCGDRSNVESSAFSFTGLKWQPQSNPITITGQSTNIGARGVRSAIPRRKPEDFLHQVTE